MYEAIKMVINVIVFLLYAIISTFLIIKKLKHQSSITIKRKILFAIGLIAIGTSNYVFIDVLLNSKLLVIKIICLVAIALGIIAVHYSYENCDKNKSNCD